MFGISRILDNKNISNKSQLSFLFGCQLFICIFTRIPKLSIFITHWTFFALCGWAHFYIPKPSGSLKSMLPISNKWNEFAINRRQKSDNSIAITSFINVRIQKSVVIFFIY